MADQNLSVSGPITVRADAATRVAYDLMNQISNFESDKFQQERNTREYWLKLYRQCYRATHGNTLKGILEDEPPR